MKVENHAADENVPEIDPVTGEVNKRLIGFWWYIT